MGGDGRRPRSSTESDGLTMTTLLLDMDGVLADFDRRFWEVMFEILEYDFDIDRPDQQRRRFFTDHMTNIEQRSHARALVSAAGWFEQLPVVDGAAEGIDELLSSDLDVWVCSKPLIDNPTCRDGKAAWLKKMFPGTGLEEKLIMASDKSMIRGDILLDDAPKVRWLATGRAEWRPVIFDAPYNREGSVWGGIRRWTWGMGVERLLGER